MADELGIRVKLNIDEAGSKSLLNSQIASIEKSIRPIKIKIDIDGLDNVKSQLKGLENLSKITSNAGKSLQAKLKIIDAKDINNASLLITKLQRQVTSLVYQMSRGNQSKILATGKQFGFDNLAVSISDAAKRIPEFRNELEKIGKEKSAEKQIQMFKELRTEIDAATKEAQNMNLVIGDLNKETQWKTTKTKWENLLKANPNYVRSSELVSQANQINAMLASMDDFDRALTNSKIAEFKGQLTSLGLEGVSMFNHLGKSVERFFNYFLSGSIIFTAINALTQMYNYTLQIDTAMTDLRKVTDETAATYDTFLTSAGAKAKEIGTTVRDIISSTADFARLGFSFEEAFGLSEAANIYRNVGDMDIESATEAIISTSKAFDIAAEDSIDIVDKFNEVGNNFAISSEGIGEAMKRSASALVAAGNDIDKSIALITAGNVVTQDPESVGDLRRAA